MVTVLTKDEELVKAEAEAWHKTHYRSEWFVGRTLGYGILVTTLAIYFFWDATRWSPSRNDMQIGSAVWIALLALGLMFFDFRARLTNETWGNVFRRIHKHLALSVATFLISLVTALGVHTAAADVAGQLSPIQAPAIITEAPIQQPIPAVTVIKSKPPAKKAKVLAKPSASATAKPASKPPPKKPAAIKAPAKAKAPAAKTKPVPAKKKPAAKKSVLSARKQVAARKMQKKKTNLAQKPKAHKKKLKRTGTLERSVTKTRSRRFYAPEATAG